MMMIGISEHGVGKCNRWLKRVAVAVKLVPSTSPVIPSLLFFWVLILAIVHSLAYI